MTRPPVTRLALAVDLGGTKIDAALVDDDGVVIAASRTRRPTGPGLDPARLRAAVHDVVQGALAALPAGGPPSEMALAGVGIGAAGPVDFARETIAPVNLPGVQGFPLVAAVRDAVGALADETLPDTPIRLRHDGACIALAEAWRGATTDASASMSIIVSTGIGGGIVVRGAALAGGSGNAGHLGQVAAPAGFGADGATLEDVASGPSSVRWARAQGWQGETGEDLGRDAAAGDATARAAIERSARAVGTALADAATLLDLEVIAIGGGFSHVSGDYVTLVADALRAAAVLPYARAARVVRAGLGADAPLVGAAALVLG